MDSKKGKSDSDPTGACGKVMSQINELIRNHGIHVVVVAALAAVGLYAYNRYGKNN